MMPRRCGARSTALFAAEGFRPLGDEAASAVVEDEDRLPDGEDWYGVIVSGVAGAGWVSVYVADWQDSGALARGLSARLRAPALETLGGRGHPLGLHLLRERRSAGPLRRRPEDRRRDARRGKPATPASADGMAPVLQVPVAGV